MIDIGQAAAFDPNYLQQVEGSTMRITLQPGEKKVQDIRLPSQ